MKEQLIQLAKEKRFQTKVFTPEDMEYDEVYYLWLCELQKWLREEHLNNVVCYRKSGFSFWFYSLNEFHKHKVLGEYQEALEQGLFEALKLIEQ